MLETKSQDVLASAASFLTVLLRNCSLVSPLNFMNVQY